MEGRPTAMHRPHAPNRLAYWPTVYFPAIIAAHNVSLLAHRNQTKSANAIDLMPVRSAGLL